MGRTGGRSGRTGGSERPDRGVGPVKPKSRTGGSERPDRGVDPSSDRPCPFRLKKAAPPPRKPNPRPAGQASPGAQTGQAASRPVLAASRPGCFPSCPGRLPSWLPPVLASSRPVLVASRRFGCLPSWLHPVRFRLLLIPAGVLAAFHPSCLPSRLRAVLF